MPETVPGSLAALARAAAADFPAITSPYDLVAQLVLRYPGLAARRRSTLRFACATAITNRATPPQAEPVPAATTLSMQQEGSGLVIEFPTSQSVKTLAELLAATDVNPLEWEVEKQVVNKWDTHAVIDNQPTCLTNWQVKAWLKPVERVTELTVAEIARELAPLVKRQGVHFRPKQTEAHANHLLELDIFDLHLGKLCDPLETGEEYNLDIASTLYDHAVDTLLARASAFPIGTVLLPVGNDFFNSDAMVNTTTKGTPQHEAARWQRTFVRGAALIIAAVNRIRERGLKVEIVTVPGNHDFQKVFYLGQVLGATFVDCPDVRIDNTFPPRKYFQFGDCGIMYTHSNEEKEGNLAQIFAAEQPQMWAATRFREVHLAHVHHKKEFKYRTLQEHVGLTVRYMRSLSAADAWHHLKGYVGTQRSAEAFVWAKGEGVVAHLTTTVSPINSLQAA